MQRGNLTPEQSASVDSMFKTRLAELMVLKLKGDSNTAVRVAGAAGDEAGPSKGGGSSDEEEEDDDEEEEDEGGSDDEGEDDSDADDSSGEGSDNAENKDATDGSDDDAPEVSPSTSTDGRFVLRIRKAIHTEVPLTPQPLKIVESRKKLVPMKWRGKRCAYIRDLNASGSDGSDMDTGVPSGNEAVAGPSVEEEKLMKESGDSPLMAVDADMLPDIVESRPSGNRYSVICLVTYQSV